LEFREFQTKSLLQKYDIHIPEKIFLNYKNYAWRLLLANELVTTASPDLIGRTVILFNPGILWLNIPEFLVTAPQELNEGAVFLRDNLLSNSQWAHRDFIEKMEMTADDLSANGIFSDVLVFKNNNQTAMEFFKECLEIDKKHEVTTSNSGVEINAANEIVDNSHDALLYSLLLRKNKMPNISHEDLTDKVSLYSAISNRKQLYYHDGGFLEIHRLLPNIDNIEIINLERRPDRLEALYKSAPILVNFSRTFKGVDGLKLEMMPEIKNLFRNNDFGWKKSVMGCAMSHLGVWNKLLTETLPFVNNYLILEDDVRFDMASMNTLSESLKKLPSQTWDVLYLGGVLPCNRGLYENALEQVSGNWHKIKPNDFFTREKVKVRMFHHCLYSYVVSKRGAQKLLNMVKERGIWTSMDHLVMWLNEEGGEIYVHYPSVTYSYQEGEEDYEKTEYDNFGRVVDYDSDIWNNTECFETK
jgi:GR25 family glycosyltransferase involved in LPS biosynthesis